MTPRVDYMYMTQSYMNTCLKQPPQRCSHLLDHDIFLTEPGSTISTRSEVFMSISPPPLSLSLKNVLLEVTPTKICHQFVLMAVMYHTMEGGGGVIRFKI